ncbi:hypothetical protein CSUB01_11417 [Colletotrichum sublineola]|uniref:NACHT domain-containing protein n=1 Tax=Colletotrichum sublineola TaxID=1173701 RepID=A0A066XKV3_COLSU|nr:hypothetical protein CSUB01_11417 [Colletotrichum sublineola]
MDMERFNEIRDDLLQDNKAFIPTAEIKYIGWLTRSASKKTASSIVVEFSKAAESTDLLAVSPVQARPNFLITGVRFIMYSKDSIGSIEGNKKNATANVGGKLSLKRSPKHLSSGSDVDESRPRKKTAISSDTLVGETVITVEEYTIGWVCALPLEMAAAKGMLDRIHPNLSIQDSADHNSYILGQVQDHKVVIACLPAGTYGITSAATVAKDLLRTFKSIRFGLMVGIGGGAPSQTHDIRLGDIVVSQPTATSGGIIQYDRGKIVQEGEFERTGALSAPPQLLLAALNRLQADHMSEESRIPQVLSELVRKSPKKMKDKFGYQGTLHDHLFQAEYNHANPASTCTSCDPTWAIHRDDRDDKDPVIHYGGIASGNKVIKDGIVRDKLSRELGVLCFEMEAAGLQDFPCLVIRGVCDYADSHKDKRWQAYAAATASAFAKELLSVIPPTRVLQEEPIPRLVSDPRLHELVSHTNTAILAQTHRQDSRYESEEQDKYLQALKTSSYETFKNINPGRVQGTCKWVLDHTRYRAWQQSLHDDLLWISADPGCGKSVLAKSLIDEDFQCTNEHTVCYFFFKDNENQNNLTTALCALLHQLFCFQPILLHYVGAAFALNGKKLRAEVDELWRIFIAAATDGQAPSVTCVLDALDECCVDDRRKIIQFLTNFYNHQTTPPRKSQLKFLVTSRPYQDIELEFRNILEPQTIHLAGEESNTDISEEINHGIKFKVATAGHQLRMNHEVQAAIQEKLLSVPHRTYLWLHLVIDELYQSYKRTKKAFIKKVDTLPITVEDAYEKILGRLNRNQRREAETLLHIVVSARRPLTLSEMDVALQLATNSADALVHEDLDLDHENLESHIRQLCGLFVFVNDNRIYLIHQTAKEFLITHNIPFSQGGNSWKQSLYVPYSNMIMTQVCVQYLSLRDIKDDELPPVTRHLLTNHTPYPFLNYSAVHWPAHLRDAHPLQKEVQDQILNLYGEQNPRFETWVLPLCKGNRIAHDIGGITNVFVAVLNCHDEVLSQLLTWDDSEIDYQGRTGQTPLYWACTKGYDKIVQILLIHGADISTQGGLFGNALQAASSSGHENITQILLSKRADVNAQGGEYGNAIQAALCGGHENIIQMLLIYGADFNPAYKALYNASSRGDDNIVRMLLTKGADVTTQGRFLGNALQAASKAGHESVVRMLLHKGADVNASGGYFDIHAEGGYFGNALQAASKGGYDNIVRILLRQDVDVNAEGGEYGNSLYAASDLGHEKIVEMLLTKGADLNRQNRYPGTPLQVASARGHYSIIQMLLNYGADVNTQCGQFDTALQAASGHGDRNIIQMLLDKGADVNAQGGLFGNALQAASFYGYKNIAQILISKGADVNARGGRFGNALQAASFSGYNKIVEMLLIQDADVNAEGGEYDNALRAASSGGDRDKARKSNARKHIIQMLLDKGADVNAQGGRLGSALQAASSSGYIKIVEMLISKGADVNAQGGKYGNALQAASKGGYKRIVEMLLSKGADVNASSSKPPQLSFPSDSAPSGIGLSGGAHAAGSVAAGPGR